MVVWCGVVWWYYLLIPSLLHPHPGVRVLGYPLLPPTYSALLGRRYDSVDGVSRWFQALYARSDVRYRLRQRWEALRRESWSTPALTTWLREEAASIRRGVERNGERWAEVLERSWYDSPTQMWEEGTGQLEAWLTQRLTWMDQALSGLG